MGTRGIDDGLLVDDDMVDVLFVEAVAVAAWLSAAIVIFFLFYSLERSIYE